MYEHNSRLLFNLRMELVVEDENSESKILASTPILRNMVPSLHLLVAVDTYYTP